MPVHNAERYVLGAVESILGQSWSDFEFLIVNDGSTDGTRDRLAGVKDPRLRIVDTERAGVAGALRLGLHLARGRYIARMDADDESLPHRLARQKACLDEQPGVGMVHGRAECIDGEGRPLGLDPGGPPVGRRDQVAPRLAQRPGPSHRHAARRAAGATRPHVPAGVRPRRGLRPLEPAQPRRRRAPDPGGPPPVPGSPRQRDAGRSGGAAVPRVRARDLRELRAIRGPDPRGGGGRAGGDRRGHVGEPDHPPLPAPARGPGGGVRGRFPAVLRAVRRRTARARRRPGRAADALGAVHARHLTAGRGAPPLGRPPTPERCPCDLSVLGGAGGTAVAFQAAQVDRRAPDRRSRAVGASPAAVARTRAPRGTRSACPHSGGRSEDRSGRNAPGDRKGGMRPEGREAEHRCE